MGEEIQKEEVLVRRGRDLYRKEKKKISKKMVYHNHSHKKARHYPVDTIRPPRLLKRAPRKGSNGGGDTERRSAGQKRKGPLYRKDERAVFHPRQEETKRNTAKYLGIATPILPSWEPLR